MTNSRHEQLINILQVHHMLTISELSSKLEVSEATIRRDLDKLYKSGEIRRIPGGALSLEGASPNVGEQALSAEDPLLIYKRAIADAAVALVKPGDTIFIDSGSTNNEIARKLCTLSDISIVTNSIEIAYMFNQKKNISTFICGGTMGEVNPYSSIVGPIAEKMILQFRANIAFIGMSGIHETQGLTCSYLSTASIKQAMINNSSHSVLITDHSKFGRIYKAFVCSLDKFDQIITDKKVPPGYLNFLKNTGLEIIQVSTSND